MSELSRCASLRRALSARIINGEWQPGQRLPGRSELLQRYGGSMSTLQKAMSAMIEDGLLQSQGGHGTVVAPDAPCLWRIGLGLLDRQANRLAQSMLHSAEDCLQIYAGLQHDHGDWHNLLDDLADGRLRGLILMAELHHLSQAQQQALLDHPLVIVGFHATQVPRLHLDLYGTLRQVIIDLHQAGKKRVACLLGPRRTDQLQKRMRDWCKRRGMAADTWQFLEVNTDHPQSAGPIIDLWMTLPSDQRPDAIIIADDHLVPNASRALAKLKKKGQTIPQVIAHANLPKPSRAYVPCKRYGYDMKQIMEEIKRLFDGDQKALTELQATYLDV